MKLRQLPTLHISFIAFLLSAFLHISVLIFKISFSTIPSETKPTLIFLGSILNQKNLFEQNPLLLRENSHSQNERIPVSNNESVFHPQRTSGIKKPFYSKDIQKIDKSSSKILFPLPQQKEQSPSELGIDANPQPYQPLKLPGSHDH